MTHIRSDYKLYGDLWLMQAKPVEILLALHSDVGRANSLPPAGANEHSNYFGVKRFDGPEYYIDIEEYSDEEVEKRAGGRETSTGRTTSVRRF